MSGAGNNNRSTYVPLFRGIEPYLWAYSPAAISVYLWLLIKARFKGDDRGTVTFSLAEIQDGDPDPSGTHLIGGVNLSPKTIRKALEELSLGHLSNVPPGREAPPFIEIIRRPTGGGRGLKIKIKILRAKLSGLRILTGVDEDGKQKKPSKSKKAIAASTAKTENRNYSGRDTLDEYIKKVASKVDASWGKR